MIKYRAVKLEQKTNIKDVVKFAAKQIWKWSGHVARLNNNRWTKRITDWQPRYGKRSRGRQVKRWRDDIVQMKGITRAEMPDSETTGDVMRRATYCSGWTEPLNNIIIIIIIEVKLNYDGIKHM